MPYQSPDELDNLEPSSRYSYDSYGTLNDSEAASHALLDSPSTLRDDGFDLDFEPSTKQKAYTPVPRLQLMTLCAVRIVDPISFTQLFPYVNEMLLDLHVTEDPSRIGFYSGLVDSLFAVSQLFSIYHWAKLSDRVGRRPVIFASTIGIAVCTSIFGLSTTLFQVLAARCISGFLAGNIAVIHSTVGELTNESNQAIAFSIYGLVWPLGSIMGPLIGGTFSHPNVHFPAYFDNEWFRGHPYFLPCFICSILSVSAAMFGLRFLEETHPVKRVVSIIDWKPTGKPGASHSGQSGSETIIKQTIPVSLKSLLADPLLKALCLSGFTLSFLASAFDVVFVLFCFSPIATGGLSRPADQIGYSLAISGLTSACLQLFLMPWLLRTFDLAVMYKFTMALFPCAFFSLPLLNRLARMGVDSDGNMSVAWVSATLWLGIAVTLAMSRIAVLSFSLSMILVKNAAPSPEALGTTNGLAQFSQCLARSVSPAFVSSLFALSIGHNLLGGYLWVVVMCSLGILSSWIASRISDARAKSHAHGS